jgi:hypothetical protein
MAKMWYEEWPSEDFFDSQEEIDPAEDISENETLGNAISQERRAEFEQSLVQDEHPRDYDSELEDEIEEAAPTSDKRLKREIKAEALRRLEEAARTEADFQAVINQWDKLDQNRERRERDHENLRGDVPLEYQTIPNPSIAPIWMNDPAFRQLCHGNYLDILFDCPHELHNLAGNPFISELLRNLNEDQQEILYFLFVRLYSTTRLAEMRHQSDRNIRKQRKKICAKLQKRMYDHLIGSQRLTKRERTFLEEYEKAVREQGKNAAIPRENKTKPRQEKAALDEAKSS